MNSELFLRLPLIDRAIDIVGAVHEHYAEEREKARLQAQAMAALEMRASTKLALTSGSINRNSVIVTQENNGTINVIGQMTRKTRSGLEAWIQYFTVAPDNTIMAGKTHPKAPRDLEIEMKPFQIGDLETVRILSHRMTE